MITLAHATTAAPAESHIIADGEVQMTLALAESPGIYSLEVGRKATRNLTDHASRAIKAADWRLTIRCLNKCSCPDTYREDLGTGSAYSSGLLGVWQVLDDNPAIVSSWLSGQTYTVRIYGCRAGHIVKWFEGGRASIAAVTPGDDPSHMPVVTLPSDRYGQPKEVWTWDGQRYRTAGRSSGG